MKLLIDTRNIGFILIITGLILLGVTYQATDQVIKSNEIIHRSCNLPEGICPYVGFPVTSIYLLIIISILLAYGLYLIFSSKESEKVSESKNKEFEKTISMLKGDEKKIYEILIENDALFQSEIIEKTSLNKVKISRILDKLEGRGLVERKRRGLSNVLIPKKVA